MNEKTVIWAIALLAVLITARLDAIDQDLIETGRSALLVAEAP